MKRTRAGVAIATAAAILGAAAPGARAVETIVAGPLRAYVGSAPWHLRFADPRGQTVLEEDRSTGGGATGALGFRTNAGWWRATRVLSSRRDGAAYEATLTTSDPAGRRLAVRIAPDASGVIALRVSVGGPFTADVTAVGIGFGATSNERFLGFGERSNAVDQRGGTVESYVAEGPYQPDERVFVTPFVPPPGYHPRDDPSYFPMPWLLSTRGYGVLDDDPDTSYFHLGDAARAWSVEVDSTRLQLRVFAGPRPADVLRRLSRRLGRQPPAAAPWYFGPWFQPVGKSTSTTADGDAIARLRRADAPASVAQTYTHYLPCGDHLARRAAQRERTRLFHAAGIAVTTYFNPMICTSYHPRYDQAKAARVLTQNAAGQPYEYRYTGSSQFFVAQFDFSAPGATPFFGGLLREATADGYDGWMEDFGEYTPTDARSADGMPGAEMHNVYPLLYHRAAYEFARTARRPLARFNRSGWTGSARYSQLVWGGDPTTDWGFDGLASAVRNGLTMGLSGVSMWGSDIGGFFGLLGKHVLTPELLARWIEVGAVSGIMRTQANGSRIPDDGKRRAQIFDPDVLPVWRRYAKLRTQLYPYIAAAERQYDDSGMPLMRHLSLAYPSDRRATAIDDEFMFGPDLLAAPVLTPNARSRRLYLPPGRWVDLWRAAAVARSGRIALRRARAVAGGRFARVPAPVSELPLLIRAGTVLPLLPADVDTLTGYGRTRRLVHLRDRAGRLQLLAFPRGRTRGALGPGERWSSREGRHSWTLGIAGRRARRYELQVSLSTVHRPMRGCGVRVNGGALPRRAWRYDSRRRVLHASFRLRRGTLTVVGCAR